MNYLMKQTAWITQSKYKEHFWALVLLIPTLIPLLIFWIYPMFKTLTLSFTDWNYISPNYNFVGLDNYKEVLTNDNFHQVLINTLVFSLGTVLPPIIIGLFFATLLTNIQKGKSLFLICIFSSWITPAVVVSTVWLGIFGKDDGLVNQVIEFFGGTAVPWLWQGSTAMIAVIVVTIWQYLGLSTLLLTSAMTKMDPSIFEAAALDGARGMRKFLKITFPAISPTVFFLIILFLLNSLKAYDQIYILTQGGPSGATSTLLYYYYVAAFDWFETGTASTVAIMIVIVSVTISGINFLYSNKWVKY